MGPAPPPGPPRVAQGPADGGRNPRRRRNSGISGSSSDSWIAQKEPTIRQPTIRKRINTFFMFSPYSISINHHKNVLVQATQRSGYFSCFFPQFKSDSLLITPPPIFRTTCRESIVWSLDRNSFWHLSAIRCCFRNSPPALYHSSAAVSHLFYSEVLELLFPVSLIVSSQSGLVPSCATYQSGGKHSDAHDRSNPKFPPCI